MIPAVSVAGIPDRVQKRTSARVQLAASCYDVEREDRVRSTSFLRSGFAIRAAGLTALLLQACVAPKVRTRYDPLHPGTGVDTSFRIRASAPCGIRKVELFLYEYEAVDATHYEQRTGGTWGLVKVWDYCVPFPGSIVQTYVHCGFPANSYVTYLFRVTQTCGSQTSEAWSLAAGDWPPGWDPIPLLVGEPGRCCIDMCFVAQEEDYGDARGMLDDLIQLIFDGYHESNALEGSLRYNWQFYYTTELGHYTEKDATDPWTGVPFSVRFSTTIDTAAVIHTTPMADWGETHYFGCEPFNVGTALHESGHATFDLGDEYPGGWFRPPVPTPGGALAWQHYNNYQSELAAQDYNVQWHWPASDVEQIESGWWRPEPACLACIMLDDQDRQLPDFARTCIRRILEYYQRMTLPWTGFP